MSDEISEARRRRADGMIECFEASWRAAWADHCAKTGKTVPFEEWFYATDENGDSPFEIAGGWFLSPRRG